MVLYVRTSGGPAPVLGLAQRAARNVVPQVGVRDASTIAESVNNNLWIARVVVVLFAASGILALALASAGLYGVLAFNVERRRREMRMALGATRLTVARLVVSTGLLVVGEGVAVGLGRGLLAGGAMPSALPSVPAADPFTFVNVRVVLVAVAGVLSCWIPPGRASGVRPDVGVARRLNASPRRI